MLTYALIPGNLLCFADMLDHALACARASEAHLSCGLAGTDVEAIVAHAAAAAAGPPAAREHREAELLIALPHTPHPILSPLFGGYGSRAGGGLLGVRERGGGGGG